MKTHHSRWIIVAAIGILGVSWWGVSKYHSSQSYINRRAVAEVKKKMLSRWQGTEKIADTDPRGFGPYKGMGVKELWKNRPPVMYCISQKNWWNPQNEAELRMLQWRNAMDKADPLQDFQIPIEFYGLVLDQYDKPIPGAGVSASWLVYDHSVKKELDADQNGRFCITGERTTCIMRVGVGKLGYEQMGWKSASGFELLDFYNPNYYYTTPEKPFVFRLWKFENAEPMYRHRIYLPDQPMDGTIAWFNLEKICPITSSQEKRHICPASDGEIGFSATLGEKLADSTNMNCGYTFTVYAAPGGGIALGNKNDEMMFQAPDDCYKPSVAYVQPAAARGSQYAPFYSCRFYLKTPTGRYAAVTVKAVMHNTSSAATTQLSASIYYNPSGSRNLQFDYTKMIEPKR